MNGPNGDRHQFSLAGEDAITVEVDGIPLFAVIGDSGPGWWPDGNGEQWQPLTAGATVTERTLHVHGISEQQYYGISTRLNLPRAQFGRFKGTPGQHPGRRHRSMEARRQRTGHFAAGHRSGGARRRPSTADLGKVVPIK
ncbi:hypothetical protein [Actinoplanes aureus]|uniref:Uncharacterized protein n=1 Tax=Actinoplanes aureus TaxID=2792083 RepID=A0A931CKM5_9ACTN|nr:hypothetical protein [Actinoplanes aureus]MBG0568791.1 hypothetical protein [Actinoplanes aureus]